MKKYLLTTICLLFACLAWAQTDADDIVKVGDAMPSFTITHDDGTKLASTQWKGKVILVNLFATWCPPCQKELAAVKQTLWPKYKDNKDFVMLVIGRREEGFRISTLSRQEPRHLQLVCQESHSPFLSDWKRRQGGVYQQRLH